MKTILIADDNVDIIELLLPNFNLAGYKVDVAVDGIEAISKFDSSKHHLILLDIMMPKMDGMTVCKRIREISDVPIIMITAKSEDEDVIMGLDIGADDYIVKPFSPRQVVAKVEAVLRRLKVDDNKKVLSKKNLLIDIEKFIVKINDEKQTLTKKEIEILYLMASHPGRVYSREILLNILWGVEYFGDIRTVDTHIKRMRSKLDLNNKDYKWDIKTVWGVGYKFEEYME